MSFERLVIENTRRVFFHSQLSICRRHLRGTQELRPSVERSQVLAASGACTGGLKGLAELPVKFTSVRVRRSAPCRRMCA